MDVAAGPPGWISVGEDVHGVPLWKRRDEPCYVATRDMDQLRFIAVALSRFDQMSGPEFRAFVTDRRSAGGNDAEGFG